MTINVLVGSKNRVKISAVEAAFINYFSEVNVDGVFVDSEVAKQPVGKDTFLGATNRVKNLMKLSQSNCHKIDYFVGIESGLTKLYSKWFIMDWICISNSSGIMHYGTTPCYTLPSSLVKKILEGKELCEIMNELTGEMDIKYKGGAIGYFSKNVVSRKEHYVQGTIMSLIPFINLNR
jgi:inosine/xanthosine triphosphatase